MIIELRKFGATLTSRQFGRESYVAFLPTLREIKKREPIEIDFNGVNTIAPSWADEFLTPLVKEFAGRVKLRKSSNLSVIETIKFLERINQYKLGKN